MAGASSPSLPYGRRSGDFLATRQQRLASRLSRERARNARLAFLGFVVLGVILAVGMRGGLLPGDVGSSLPASAPPGSFAATHMGTLLFTSVDGVLCKQFRFNNDTGGFSDGKLVHCEEAEEAASEADSEAPPPPGPNGRTHSIRGAFSR